MTSLARAKFRGKSEWLRRDSKWMSQLRRLALKRAGYTTLASCHFLTGVVIGFLDMCTFNTYCIRLA